MVNVELITQKLKLFFLLHLRVVQKKYQEILTKFEKELEKPFQDAMDFSWQMEHYLGAIPPSRGRSEIGSSCSNNFKDFDDEQYS